MHVLNAFPSYAAHRGPQRLGEVWFMSRGPITIRCCLSTHPQGWELGLRAADNFFRTQICWSEQQVRDVSDAWQAEAVAKGFV